MRTTELGDILYSILKATGINWLVYKLTNGKCNCCKRKEFLNKLTARK